MNEIYWSHDAQRAVENKYRALLQTWPTPNRQLIAPTRMGDAFVLSCGPEDAPPVLLFHGSQANSSVYMFDALVWSRTFRLHAIDMIGEPGLSAPIRPALDSDAHALWLDDILDALELASAMIIGMSLGGWLALDYASRRPEKVTRLALLCPAGIGRQKNFLLKAFPLLLLGGWGKRKMREIVMGPERPVPPDAKPLAELLELIGTSVRPRIIKIPQLSDDALSKLPPTLAIVGGRDVLLDSNDTRARLTRFAPQALVIFKPDARHYLPDQADAVLAFLKKGVAGAR